MEGKYGDDYDGGGKTDSFPRFGGWSDLTLNSPNLPRHFPDNFNLL